MYWRHGALAYVSLVKFHVLETWCSCIHVPYEVARTRDLILEGRLTKHVPWVLRACVAMTMDAPVLTTQENYEKEGM